MSCRDTLCFLLVSLSIGSCASEFCTRHSDCPPSQECGATGACVQDVVPASDGASGDATTLLDAMASSDGGETGGIPDATVGSDASHIVDGGVELLDSGLSPPTDAGQSIDSGGASTGPIGPLDPGGTLSPPHTGGGEVTEELDAGLAP